MTLLRPYQVVVVDRVERMLGTASRPLIVAPTGSGKTVIAAEIINRVVEGGGRVLVIAHRREIITQTRDKLIAAGVIPGMVLAGFERELRPMAAVQIAGIQTLNARAMRSNKMPMPAATIVIVDEAHHARAKTYQAVIDQYPDALIIGLTATPCRGDGRGLGNIFTELLEAPQVAELISGGFLVGAKVYAPVDPNLQGVKTRTGDYVIEQLARRMNTDQLVGDIVTDWLKHGERRKTIAFACDVAHSVHIKNDLVGAGVRAEHLDGSTPKGDRDAILARLASGETEVVTNCMVLTEGFDCPEIGCIILARPTRQMGLFRQTIGRGLRPAPGKNDVIILDHSGSVYRHGLPEDHVEWTLDVDGRAENPTQEKRRSGEAPKLRECPQCKVLMSAPPPCALCGWMPAQRRGQDRDFIDGELGLVVNGAAHPQRFSDEEKVVWHRMLIGEALRRGKNPNWAFYLYKDKFGHKPPWSYDRTAITPTPEVTRFVQSRVIAHAKARGPQHDSPRLSARRIAMRVAARAAVAGRYRCRGLGAQGRMDHPRAGGRDSGGL
jgi:DNA repair protein RadD